MSEVDDEREQHMREQNQMSIKATLGFLMLNESAVLRVLVRELGVPDEDKARRMFSILCVLLQQVCRHLDTDEVLDVSARENMQ